MRKVTTEEKLQRINQAAFQLMERREATDISMYDIAKECGMATSTVYHHFPNIESLLKSLLDTVFDEFDHLLENCIDENKVTHWTDINRMIETAYVEYYNQNPIAKKLILGRHTFSELGHADTEHDLELGDQVEAIYRQFFDIPKMPEPINVFAICLQVADKIYSLSYREHGYITSEMASEAVRLTQSYLQLYIPNICHKTKVPEIATTH